MLSQVFSINTYVNYFRLMAASHTSIGHELGSEGPDADKSKSRFAIFSHDEVLTGLRSRIGDGVVLFLHPYFIKPKSNGAGDYRGVYSGAFIIAKKANKSDIADWLPALNECEFIAYGIAGQLVNDSNEFGATCKMQNPFSGCLWDDMKFEPVMNLWDGRFGWYVEFEFTLKQAKFLMNPALYNENTTWQPVGTPPNTYPNL